METGNNEVHHNTKVRQVTIILTRVRSGKKARERRRREDRDRDKESGTERERER